MNNEYQRKSLTEKIIITSKSEAFDEDLALQIFAYQYVYNPIYNQFCDYLHKSPCNVSQIDEIPFLPISFFKTHDIKCINTKTEAVFFSSGTTGMERSKHLISNLNLYHQVALNGFISAYDHPSQYAIMAVLPNYVEQQNSSLVYMTNRLIESSNNKLSGFYLNDYKQLIKNIAIALHQGTKVILLGVTYALLDLAEKYGLSQTSGLIVMETGGMKGRRKEMIKEELHQQLMNQLNISEIHSEYGMTELMSQAYSSGNGIFRPTKTMKILIRDVNDPISIEPIGRTGGVNIIDLANLDSCSFIATQDLGKLIDNERFELLGRFDQSDIRGCNLLVDN